MSNKKKGQKLKKVFKKYGIFSTIAIGLFIMIFTFANNFSNTQPNLNINVGATTYNAINQAISVETMFEKTKNEYESPVETIEQRRYNAIKVSKNEKIVLETERISGLKTTLVPPDSNSINFKMWKNNSQDELQVKDAAVYTDNSKYKISMIAPDEEGEYVVSLNLDYSKSKMRYTFKIEVI